MLAERQLAAMPDAAAAAFLPRSSAQWDAMASAHAAIGPMYWGPRRTLADACKRIRGWIRAELSAR